MDNDKMKGGEESPSGGAFSGQGQETGDDGGVNYESGGNGNYGGTTDPGYGYEESNPGYGYGMPDPGYGYGAPDSNGNPGRGQSFYGGQGPAGFNGPAGGNGPYPCMPQGGYERELEEPVSMGEWLVSLLLIMFVPCVNIVLMFVWAFSKKEKKSKSNFFKAQLILTGIMLVIYIVVIAVFGVAFLATLSY